MFGHLSRAMPTPQIYWVLISARAQRDLDGIHAYLAAVSPQAAASVVLELVNAINSLDVFPHRYAVPRTGKPRGRATRSMPVRPYLVRYRIDESAKLVTVLFVRHGARRRP